MSRADSTRLQSLFSPDDLSGVSSLLVAVSGGVDSVVLLHLLRSVASDCNVAIRVAHLDHRVRPESERDADFVRFLCREWGLPCQFGRVDVPELAKEQGLSLEMAGRQARREYLQAAADTLGCERIVLGHHCDDQLETFLLRLLRGTGISGLAAMQKLQGRWWRPLLNVGRQQLLDYARQQGLRWVEDETNRDPVYLRNRLRHQVVPRLREVNPQLDERLAALTRQVQLEEDYWQWQVEQVFPGLVISRRDGLRLDRQQLLGLHPALRMRVYREALRRVRGDLQRVAADHLRAVERLLSGQRAQAQLDLPGCWVARRYQQLWLRSEPPPPPQAYDLELPVPGALQLPDGRILHAVVLAEQQGEAQRTVEFALAELPGPLRVRSWQPGDRFAPAGMAGHKRLKRFFSDEQLELEERSALPLLVCGETILWLVGRRRSRHAPASLLSGPVLRLELI